MSVMPATGITLPFLSYGGSSILSNMMAMGLVINVAIRNRGVQFDKEQLKSKESIISDADYAGMQQ
jgi:cell division protein FtsW (lipid II flippase)